MVCTDPSSIGNCVFLDPCSTAISALDTMRNAIIAGQTSSFAMESEITRAFERPSCRGLRFFVIHVMGRRYRIKSRGNTVLAVSFDELEDESLDGKHKAPFAEAAVAVIASAYTSAVYLDQAADGNVFWDERGSVYRNNQIQPSSMGCRRG
jgi:hypothetical protein